MSTYEEHEKAALMVIDVQIGVVDSAWKRDEIVSRIADLVSRARDSDVEVIWVQHSESEMPIGGEYWQIVPELKPVKNEKIIHKIFRSAFEETELEEVLEELDIGHLVITGAQTNYCVRHTIHAGIERGFNITLVEDAHTTMDESWDGVTISAEQIVAELNRACSKYQLPDSFVDVAKAESIHF
ncbi:MAG TPA: isochorismatase family protein [Candidatus Nanopelagicaceae bacterium]